MPWFKLDDSFHSHPKVMAAGNEAVGLFVRCGTYAAQHLTDGFIPQQVVLLYGSEALADTLVEAKLWRRTRGGWQIHDYLNYNPSKQAVNNDRKNNADRQRRWQEARRNAVSNGAPNGVSNSAPTRPDPKPPNPPQAGGCPRHQRPRPGCDECAKGPPATRHPSARTVQQAIDAATKGIP